MKHYSEVDLLEHYYLPSDDSAVSEHVAVCTECLERFSRLQAKLQAGREASCASVEQKPETFWKRQQFSIRRKIDSSQPARRMDVPRVAAAAALVVVLGGGGVWLKDRPPKPVSPAAVRTSTAVAQVPSASPSTEILAETRSDDPWASEELSDLHGVVQWESWEVPGTASRKGTS